MLAYITPVGEHGLYQIHEVHGRTDPGFGVGGAPHPGHGLPGSPPHVGGGPIHNPNFPNNTLPSGPPPHIQVGATLVLVRDPMGVWHYAALPPGQPAPTPLPVPPPTAAPKL